MKISYYILIAAVLALIAFFSVTQVEAGRQWVRGASAGARHCYPAGQENGNIRYRVYFSTLEDCVATLQIE